MHLDIWRILVLEKQREIFFPSLPLAFSTFTLFWGVNFSWFIYPKPLFLFSLFLCIIRSCISMRVSWVPGGSNRRLLLWPGSGSDGSHWTLGGQQRAPSPDLSSVINFSCRSGLSHRALPDFPSLSPSGRLRRHKRADCSRLWCWPFWVSISRYLCNSCVCFGWVWWLAALSQAPGLPQEATGPLSGGYCPPSPLHSQLRYARVLH